MDVRKCIALSGILLLLIPLTSHGGKLDDFEKAAATPQHQQTTNTSETSDDPDDGECHGFFSCLLSELFSEVSINSPARLDDGPGGNSRPRAELDFAYQRIDPTIYALDTSFHSPAGLFDLDVRYTGYVESMPPDSLNISRLSLTLPMRFSDSLKIGVGAGFYELAGNTINSGLSFSLPFTYQSPDSPWTIGLSPTWADINGNTIRDVDLRLSYRTKKASFFIGNRDIQAGSQSLGGPYVGAGFIF